MKIVNEPNKNKIEFKIGIIGLLILLLEFSFTKGETMKTSIILTILIFGFLLFLVFAFRPRICPSCKKKMRPHYPVDNIFPDYFYCLECETKILTDIKSDYFG